jgi:hypothetical protein
MRAPAGPRPEGTPVAALCITANVRDRCRRWVNGARLPIPLLQPLRGRRNWQQGFTAGEMGFHHSKKSRRMKPAALIVSCRQDIDALDSVARLLCGDHSQLPLRREIPEHDSDQQQRRHVANQVTDLVSVIRGLYCHDAGVHDARPDRE